MSLDICLDANIFIASLSPEKDHDLCRELFKRLKRHNACFYEPSLVVFEVGSAFRKKIAEGEFSEDEAGRAVELFYQIPLLLQWHDFIVKKSLFYAGRLCLRNSYDASYLAVAESREIAFVSLDAEFLKKARRVYQNVFHVREYLKKM